MTGAATSDNGPESRPLVIKGIERIEAIVLRHDDVRRHAQLYTHGFGRTLRRDFNVTSVAIFFARMNPDLRQGIWFLLDRLTEEARLLEDLARPYEMPRGPALTTCPMRIICDEADVLFDALHLADRSLFKIIRMHEANLTEEELADPVMYKAARRRIAGISHDTAARFYDVFSAVKKKAIRKPAREASDRG
jgi:hypothetical protein